ALVDRGADVMARSGVYGLLVLMNASLPLAYTAPAGVKPLVMTGDLVQMAPRRLFETLRFVLEMCVPGALRPGGDGWALTARVRLIHASVRDRLSRSPEWRAADWGVPINQFDMLGTNLAFSASFMQGMRRLGFSYAEDESRAVMELWRVSGHWIGVTPELLVRTEGEGRRAAAAIMVCQEMPDDDSRALVESLLRVPFVPWATQTNRVMSTVYAALSRALIGNVYADALGYPHTPVAPILAGYRVAASASDWRRRSLPAGERIAVELGRASWRTALGVGLGGRPAEFRIPGRGGAVRSKRFLRGRSVPPRVAQAKAGRRTG
ncbi:MAG: DUF2236 domain-containing protein, partial [Myxococcales bacterium]|nr:DUF2236 domain-containing protein [Myxococcales bacterium]